MKFLCAVCKKDADKSCGECKNAHYCSAECQKKDWPTHKKLCPLLKESRGGSDISDEILKVYRGKNWGKVPVFVVDNGEVSTLNNDEIRPCIADDFAEQIADDSNGPPTNNGEKWTPLRILEKFGDGGHLCRCSILWVN